MLFGKNVCENERIGSANANQISLEQGRGQVRPSLFLSPAPYQWTPNLDRTGSNTDSFTALTFSRTDHILQFNEHFCHYLNCYYTKLQLSLKSCITDVIMLFIHLSVIQTYSSFKPVSSLRSNFHIRNWAVCSRAVHELCVAAYRGVYNISKAHFTSGRKQQSVFR